MRICYLILCHKNDKQLDKLIRQLSDDDSDFYIHVDKKTSSFHVPQLPNVFSVDEEKRVSVSWGTFSIVKAILTLIDLACENGRYDRFCLLSGQCFPIKSTDRIREFFESAPEKNYIDAKKASDGVSSDFIKRNELYYPDIVQRRNVFSKILKNVYIAVTGGKKRTFSLFRRKAPDGMEYAFGGMFWSFTYDCMYWIKRYVDGHPEYLDFYQHALVPDESFFQTLFSASPYYETKEDPLTYLIWNEGGNSPMILTSDDIGSLLSSRELFARKFDTDLDERVLELLAEELNR